jgi:hypothetical protein
MIAMFEFLIGGIIGSLIGAYAPELVKKAIATVQGWFQKT